MKETLKRLFCMAMALAVVVTIGACKDEKKPEPEETEQTTQETTQEETTEPVEEEPALVGKWEAEVDLSDYYSDRAYLSLGVDVVFEPCMVEVEVTFDEDGTYKTKLEPGFAGVFMDVDQSFKDTIIELSAAEAGMTVAQYERQLKAEGRTREDVYEAFAYTLEAIYCEAVLACEDEMKGKWLLEDDELYLAKKKPEKADPVIIEIEGDSFTVTEITDDDDEYGEYFLPITFTRV